MTPGLANKIALRFASKIFVTFEEAAKHLPKEKVIYTGSPVREEVLKEIVKRFSVFRFSRKSQLLRLWEAAWARKINDTAREALPELLKSIKLFTFAEKVTLMKVYKIKKDIDNLNMYMENCQIY